MFGFTPMPSGLDAHGFAYVKIEPVDATRWVKVGLTPQEE
jgi:hypothetical protein